MRVNLLMRVALILGASSVLSTGGALLIQERTLTTTLDVPLLRDMGLTRPETQALVLSHLSAVTRRYEAISGTPQFRANLELDDAPTLQHYARSLAERQGASRIVFRDRKGRVKATAGDASLDDPAAASTGSFVGADGVPYAVANVDLATNGRREGRLLVVERVPEPTCAEWRETEDAALGRARTNLLAGGACALIGALIASLAFWRSAVGPLRHLASAANRIGTGEFNTRVASLRSDEIGDLSRAVDEMAVRLERHDQTLNRRVAERTEELAKAVRSAIEAAHRAEQAQHAAEDASQAKSRFLANMSHELRTPMNGVLGLLDVLLHGSLHPDQRRMAETARRSGKQMVAIVEELLDFGSIEAGRMTLNEAEFDLRLLLEETLDALCPSAHEKGLVLASIVDDDVPARLSGDPVRLRQVVTNLVANAVKFSERGTILVQVERRALTAVQGREWRIGFAVTDEGVGIPEGDQKQIFGAFEQGDDSITRRSGGTGLGLAVSRAIVEAMGGRISVKSKRGSGSRFAFDALLGRSGTDDPSWKPGDALLGRRLLALSDSALCRRVLERLGKSFGMEVTELPTSEDLAAKLEAEAAVGSGYDFAVVDQPTAADGLDAVAAFTVFLGGATVADLTSGRATAFVPLTAPLREQDLYRTLARLVDDDTASSPRLRRAREQLAAFDGTPSILVVEDNSVNRVVAVAALESLGASACCAEQGRAALALLAEQSFDLVLMDCQMPVMDGLEATRQIRAREEAAGLPRVPIVALTAHALAADRDACLASGMDGFLTKPLALDALASVLAEHLSPRAGNGNAVCALAESAAPAPAVAPDTTSETVLDVDALARMEHLGSEVIARLASLYLEDAPNQIRAIEDGLEAADTERIRDAAHSLKSSSAAVGAMQFSATCADLEQLARAGDLPQARPLALAVCLEFDLVCDALRALGGTS